MRLLQDECRGLSRWFASRLDAREVVRNNLRDEFEEWELYNDQPSREG